MNKYSFYIFYKAVKFDFSELALIFTRTTTITLNLKQNALHIVIEVRPKQFYAVFTASSFAIDTHMSETEFSTKLR